MVGLGELVVGLEGGGGRHWLRVVCGARLPRDNAVLSHLQWRGAAASSRA